MLDGGASDGQAVAGENPKKIEKDFSSSNSFSKGLGFLRRFYDDLSPPIGSAAIANSVRPLERAALLTFDENRGLDLPDIVASLVASCFRMLSLRHRHGQHLPLIITLIQ